MLIKKILKSIPDDCKMSAFNNMPSPITNLITDYNKICFSKNNSHVITGDTTGLQLKESIRNLDAEDQLQLLDKYKKAVASYIDPTSLNDLAEEKELLGIKVFTVKLLLLFFLTLTLISAIFYMNTGNTDIKDNKLINAVTISTKDVFSTIFNVKPKKDKEK